MSRRFKLVRVLAIIMRRRGGGLSNEQNTAKT